ncbi:carboxymuconolactone decarboxylase family protein [Antrihabitans cavernicola]|uniref:Carboxymuconolactone decarboxylase family protein n=2 Tax=Antrihabitans cavernicola TaxID=2495913 RepID=A0A5A7SHE5_9NOCA|nr:carboxymuconolactone decarboxylase family protein [Spelaeibacter cavernicola]
MLAITNQFGFLPSAVALMAESPELLQAFSRANSLFQQSSLSPIARETLVLAIAERNGCELCVAMHTPALIRLGGSPESTDPALVTLRTFANAVMDTTGAVDDDQLDAFIAAGYTARNALEVVLGIGTYTLSTFANRLTKAPIDPQFAAEKDHSLTR